MNKNYFESVCESIINSERIRKFKVNKKDGEMVLHGDNRIYKISYDSNAKQISLSLQEENSENVRVLSSWLLDFESSSQKDADMIAKDFVETMAGKENKMQKQFKKKQLSDENNITGLFFANRMVNVFPELKEEIQAEKEFAGGFRSATFAKEHISPKVNALISSGENKAALTKLAKLLSDLYKNGSLDVRSIITMGILNRASDEPAFENFKQLFSDELKKAAESAAKYKGKNVKPEKPKNKKSFMSKALEAQQQMK